MYIGKFCKKLMLLIITWLILFILGGILSPIISAAEQKFPLTMEYSVMGKKRTLTVPKVPRRIISLAPNNTEILFALGLKDRIVGVTNQCNYPPEALEIAKVGDYWGENLEKIVELAPDLVISGGREELVEKMEVLGLTVAVVWPTNLQEVLDFILLVGKITDCEAKARQLISGMEQRILAVKNKVQTLPPDKRLRVYWEVWHDPLMSVGPGSFVQELIELAGGKNIFADVGQDYPTISAEMIIARDPEVIFLGHMGSKIENLGQRPGWSGITAVKNGRIYADINEDLVYRPGPRLIEGLEEIYRRLYGG